MKSTKKLQQMRKNQRKVRIAGNVLQREKECAIIVPHLRKKNKVDLKKRTMGVIVELDLRF